MPKKKPPHPDETALKRLIKVYTRRRDWFMVERLFNDLGQFFQGRF